MSELRSKIALAAVASLLVSFTVIGAASAFTWIGKPFAGFLVMGNGVVASAGLPDWPATRDGEIFQLRVVSVDGARIPDPLALHHAAAERPVGTSLVYRFEGPSGELERRIATRRFSAGDWMLIFGAYLVNGVLLGAIAMRLLSRPQTDPGLRAAVPFLCAGALWGLSAMDLYGVHVLFRGHALCEALLFGAALHMALCFPTPLLGPAATRRLVGAGYAATCALAVAYQIVLFEPASYVRVHLLATSLAGLALLLVVVGLLVRTWRSRGAPVRTALGVLAGGACLALLMPVALTLPEMLNGGTSPQNAVGWTVFLFPASMGYAIRPGERLSGRPHPVSD